MLGKLFHKLTKPTDHDDFLDPPELADQNQELRPGQEISIGITNHHSPDNEKEIQYNLRELTEEDLFPSKKPEQAKEIAVLERKICALFDQAKKHLEVGDYNQITPILDRIAESRPNRVSRFVIHRHNLAKVFKNDPQINYLEDLFPRYNITDIELLDFHLNQARKNGIRDQMVQKLESQQTN